MRPWPPFRWGCGVSIGEFLAEARRRAGFGVAQVSQLTGISERIITRIEDDDFSACGGDFYARGHIRSIARAVGADPEPLVREYDSSHGPPQGGAAASGAGPSGPLRPRQHRGPYWGVALLVVLAAVAGLVTYHFVVSQPAGSSPA